jgi:hypothetical protein
MVATSQLASYPQETLMNDLTFDQLTRRASLAALGAAGLAGLLGQATSAKQSANKKAKQQAKKKCQNQVNQCLSSGNLVCNNIEECEDALPVCCQQLADCDFTAFFTCIAAAAE